MKMRGDEKMRSGGLPDDGKRAPAGGVLELVDGCDAPDEVGALFAEYTRMLIEGDSKFQAYLDIQNYDEELLHLPTKYGRPAGRLYLAYLDGVLAGCIGLRRIDEENCEMKRLYVRPAFRGKGIAGKLVAQIISEAREIGYRRMLLDTLPFLQSALKLYRKVGFYEIGCYNDSPMETSIYMALDLDGAGDGADDGVRDGATESSDAGMRDGADDGANVSVEKIPEDRALQSASRFLSLVLRHQPEAAGITLDEHGWAQVDGLIAGMKKERPMSMELLERIVATDKKNRYSFNEDRTLIRANQGHSVPVDVELPETAPPEFLWHGTGEKYVASIDREGLRAKSRLYVHLSADVETAVTVGKRHGKPVLYRVSSGRMAADGFVFYLSVNGVWLTEAVPAAYLEKQEKENGEGEKT